MCKEITRCYNDGTICFWTKGATKTQHDAQTECERRNYFLPRVTNSDIQNKLEVFRSDDKSRERLLDNSGFWIDVHTTTISDFHWIDGSSLTGQFIYEFAGIVAV